MRKIERERQKKLCSESVSSLFITLTTQYLIHIYLLKMQKGEAAQ